MIKNDFNKDKALQELEEQQNKILKDLEIYVNKQFHF